MREMEAEEDGKEWGLDEGERRK